MDFGVRSARSCRNPPKIPQMVPMRIRHLFLPALPLKATPPATLEGAGTAEPLEALRAEEAVRQSGVPFWKGGGAAFKGDGPDL